MNHSGRFRIQPSRRALSILLGLSFAFAAPSESSTATSSPPLFAAPFMSLDTGGNPTYLAAGDLNGDGFTDLVVANYQNTFSVFLGSGNGTFGPRTTIPGRNARFALGDVNGDGKLDLVTPSDGPYDADSILVLLGNGDGTFALPHSYLCAEGPHCVALADLNGDGKLDVVVGTDGSNVSILMGEGDGTFDPYSWYSVGAIPIGICIGDVNQDGHPDAVTVNGSNSISILLGNGNGSFQPPSLISLGFGYQTRELAMGDFNGDGILDLAAPSLQWGAVTVILGDGTGNFPTGGQYWTGGTPFSIATADFNSDGRLDIVMSASVLLNQGNAIFGNYLSFSTQSGALSIVAGDFNGDSRPDIATADFDARAVTILLGHGDGTFGGPTPLVTGNLPSSVLGRDFSGDGWSDLAFTNQNSNTVSLLVSRGRAIFAPKVDFPTGPQPTFLASGDLNQDGRLDLVTANYSQGGSGTISVLLGTGAPGFTPRTDYAVGNSPTSVAIGDLDLDGHPDVAVTNVGGTVSVFHGQGNGQLANRTDYGVGQGSRMVAIGDLNEDGVPDLVTANQNTSDLSLLFGQGGGFEPQVSLPVGSGTVFTVTVVDLNNDGHLDMVVAAGVAAIFMGHGDGTFDPEVDYPVANGNTWGVGVADLDGDGKLDLALPINTGGGLQGLVSVLLGNGDGTFRASMNYGAFRGPVSLDFADLVNLGRKDVVVACANSDKVVILLNLTKPGVLSVDTPPACTTCDLKMSVRPCPADGPMTLRFVLAEPAEVAARVYDLSGRLVKSFPTARMGSGERELVWDRTTMNGRLAPAGVYFIDLRAGDRHARSRAVVTN